MKISVIIPCYSVGIKFVDEAIESVQSQTYSNWEIVFVDDCSPLQEWKSEKLNSIPKEKLKIVNNKENAGLAQSRNIGFDNSSGELILFLDADDKYASNDFFKYLIEKFENYSELEILIFNHIRFNKDNDILLEENNLKEKYYPQIKMEQFVNEIYYLQTWDKAIKKSFLVSRNIYHLNKKTPSEDGVWNYQLFCNFPNTYFTNQKFYKYRIRKNSIIDKISKEKDAYLIRVSCVANDVRSCHGRYYSDESKNLFLSGIIFRCLLKYGYKKTKKKINFINKKYCNDIWNKAAKTSFKTRLIIKFGLKWTMPIIWKFLDKNK